MCLRCTVFCMFSLVAMFCEGTKQSDFLTEAGYKTKLGLMVETKSLPLNLECNRNYKELRIGQITVNRKKVPKRMQMLAEEECKNTFDGRRVENGRHVGPSCQIWFHGELPRSFSEIVRVVFECWDHYLGNRNQTAHQIKTAWQRVHQNNVHLSCNFDQAIIKIQRIKFGRNEVDVKEFPELDNHNLEEQCYGQILEAIKDGEHEKGKVDCYVRNDGKYNGPLRIEYWCEKAPYENLIDNSVENF